MKKNTGTTAFNRWRVDTMGWTQQKAADELGCSKSQVEQLDAGVHRVTGKPVLPTRAQRMVMRAAANGVVLELWPLND